MADLWRPRAAVPAAVAAVSTLRRNCLVAALAEQGVPMSIVFVALSLTAFASRR